MLTKVVIYGCRLNAQNNISVPAVYVKTSSDKTIGTTHMIINVMCVVFKLLAYIRVITLPGYESDRIYIR